MQLKCAAWPTTIIVLKTRHAVCRIISKVYPALLKRFTIRLKRSEKFGFPIIFLNFQHISEISSKATKTLGFLRRNLAFAPRHTWEVAYTTLVRPKLEHAAPIWHSYHETQVGHVENV